MPAPRSAAPKAERPQTPAVWLQICTAAAEMEARRAVLLMLLCASLLDFASSEGDRNQKFVSRKCHNRQANYTKALKAKGRPFCPVYLDKNACWGPVAAGKSQAWPCPRRQFPRASRVSVSYNDSITDEEVPHYIARAVRTCSKEGNWTTPSVDLSRCYMNTNFKYWRLIVSYVGNAFSFASLIVAMGIFFTNKKLLTLTNQIHCHFFLALCIQIISHFLHETYEATLLKKTSMPVCYSLLSLTQFSWLSVFCWLLMEGFNIALVTTWIFGLDSLRLWNFGIMAWGVPVYLTIIWVFVDRVRASNRCNTENLKTNLESWYIDGPVLFSLAIGCGVSLFCISKLYRDRKVESGGRSADDDASSVGSTREDLTSYQQERQKRKGSKSPLIEGEKHGKQAQEKAHARLHKVKIPIALRKLMVSYLVIMAYHLVYALFLYIRVPIWMKQQWIIGAVAYKSLQGFVVALMLCFLNYDVRKAHSEAFKTWRNRRHGLSSKSRRSSGHDSNYSLPT